MKIRILAIGTKMPAWVNDGFDEYAKRFAPPYSLELCEIPAEKRTKNADIERLIEREGEKLLAAINPRHYVIALDVNGQSWRTEQVAAQIKQWQAVGRPIDLLIGGPDGLSHACLHQAQLRWSLSPLTLPHPLVRIILVEQLYRAMSLLQNHPYHR